MDTDPLTTKAEAFLALHDAPELLVLPNTWDVASTRVMAAAGFPALATTSAGVAFALGFPDGERIGRDEMLDMVARIATAVDVPVTADLEAGYGNRPQDAAETVRLALAAGVVGMNIEDGTGDKASPLIDAGLAADKVRAAREAADAAGVPFVVNARTDGFLFGAHGDPAVLREAVERGNAYLEAGARSVFVPFIADPALIGTLVKEIDGPLNVLGGPRSPSLPELRELGVARVSIGGSLARAAYGLARRAAAELQGPGTFTFNEHAIPHPEMNELMGD